MAVLQLTPSYKDYIWGGHRLVDEYYKQYDGDILAESWELSCHPDGPSTIRNGEYAGKTLAEYIALKGRGVLGTNCRRFKDFPILIKFIDARDNLSIQVHPNNEYALQNEGQYGKTEMWYIMDCEEGAFLYYGFKEEISKEEFARRIQTDTLLEALNAVPVHKGDVFFIESGTLHAIGKNIVIAEIQQNSNVTYRIYDYARVGKDGKKRQLHIDKALDVTRRGPAAKREDCAPHIASCDYFVVDKLSIKEGSVRGVVGEGSFASILVMEGEGSLQNGGETLAVRKGDSFFLPAGSGEYVITGTCEALVTTIGPKENPVRIGIDLGGTNIKIGLVDEHQRLIAEKSIPTKSERPWEEVVKDMGLEAYALLKENGIPIENCVGAGVGTPGTIDSDGVVIYSNNLEWENVPLVKTLEKYLPVPVYAANDADCAALGETAVGAGKGCENIVMLTLGTGVGGGVVINGRIFSGKLTGGCELGHMAIVEDGELCTCGRRGCLEAYASATALLRDGKAAMEAHSESSLWEKCGGEIEALSVEMIFEAAKEGDGAGAALVENYRKKLGTGIVNLVNIFRPQKILVGGGISRQGEYLLGPIREQMRGECFGQSKGALPELAEAMLSNTAGMIGAANLV